MSLATGVRLWGLTLVAMLVGGCGGPPAVADPIEEIAAALESSEAEARRQAAQRASLLDRLPSELIEKLLPLLDDPEPAVRRQGALALRRVDFEFRGQVQQEIYRRVNEEADTEVAAVFHDTLAALNTTRAELSAP